MKKHILVGLVLLVLAFLTSLFFYSRDVNVFQKQPAENINETPKNSLVIVEEKNYTGEDSVQSYKVGNIEFKVYPKKDDGVNFSWGWLEIYDGANKVFSNEPNESDHISGLLHVTFGGNHYVVVKDYSGGAHCCDTDYIFRINAAGELKLIKTWELGNATIFKDSLIEKNEKLYIAISDDRFAYFHVPYSGSYFFNQYYRLDGDNITLANDDFKDEFLKSAAACQQNLDKDLKAEKNEFYFETWFGNVLCYVSNHMLAGNEALALQGFDDYFAKFSEGKTVKDSFNAAMDQKEVKQEIIDALKDSK